MLHPVNLDPCSIDQAHDQRLDERRTNDVDGTGSCLHDGPRPSPASLGVGKHMGFINDHTATAPSWIEHLDRGCCDCRTVHRMDSSPVNRLQGTPRLFKVLKTSYARSLRGDRYQPDPAFTNSFKAWKVFPLLVGPICRVACWRGRKSLSQVGKTSSSFCCRSFLPQLVLYRALLSISRGCRQSGPS